MFMIIVKGIVFFFEIVLSEFCNRQLTHSILYKYIQHMEPDVEVGYKERIPQLVELLKGNQEGLSTDDIARNLFRSDYDTNASWGKQRAGAQLHALRTSIRGGTTADLQLLSQSPDRQKGQKYNTYKLEAKEFDKALKDYGIENGIKDIANVLSNINSDIVVKEVNDKNRIVTDVSVQYQIPPLASFKKV